MALVGAAFGIGFTLGPAIGGLGRHYLGSMAPGLLAAGFSLLALVIAHYLLVEPKRHAPAADRTWMRMGTLRRVAALEGGTLLLLMAFVATTIRG